MPDSKIRYQLSFNMSDEVFEQFNNLARRVRAKNRAQVAKNALSLLSLIVNELESKTYFILQADKKDIDGNTVITITIPRGALLPPIEKMLDLPGKATLKLIFGDD